MNSESRGNTASGSSESRDRLKAALSAAYRFADFIGDGNAMAPSDYCDENALPENKSMIRIGIYAMVRLQQQEHDKLLWASLLSDLRQFQPGVGPVPIGIGSFVEANAPQLAELSEHRADSRDDLLRIASGFAEARDRALQFESMAKTERAKDEEYLAATLGDLWVIYTAKVRAHANALLAALARTKTPVRSSVILAARRARPRD